MSIVYYHIPTDLDDAEIPNAFAVPKPLDDISMADIARHFPLPGEYHFRIRTNAGWLDLKTDTPAPLPVVGKRIVLKVLRLSWTSKNASSSPAKTASPKAAPQTVPDSHLRASPPQFDPFELHSPTPITPAAQKTRSAPVDDFDSLFR